MRQNEKAIFGLCVAAVVVGAFLALRSYGSKSAPEPEPGSKPQPGLSATASPPASAPSPLTPDGGQTPPAAASSALVGLPPAGVTSKVYPVDEKYDAVHDVMTCTVTNLKTDDARFTLLSVRWMQAGQTPEVVPTSVHFTFSTKGAARKFDESDDISLVADGKAVIPTSTKVQSTTSEGSILEYLSFTLATQDFLDFAHAKKEARVKLGAFEVRIGEEERLAMLSLASRFPRTPKRGFRVVARLVRKPSRSSRR